MIYIVGFFFISLFGSFLHFIYEISNHNKLAGIIGAINESTWEHIKMALVPYFIYSLFDALFLSSNPNYFLAKLVGALIIIILIPGIFYSYQVISKKPILIIDISSFFITILISQLSTYLIIEAPAVNKIITYFSLFGLILILGFVLLLSFFPLKHYFFKDPITGKYGFKGHSHKKSSN